MFCETNKVQSYTHKRCTLIQALPARMYTPGSLFWPPHAYICISIIFQCTHSGLMKENIGVHIQPDTRPKCVHHHAYATEMHIYCRVPHPESSLLRWHEDVYNIHTITSLTIYHILNRITFQKTLNVDRHNIYLRTQEVPG